MRIDATTVVIWALRILLPILFFAIYFKLKEPKQLPAAAKETKNAKNVYSRGKLLRMRTLAKGLAAPSSVKNIALKDQTQAPELFAGGRSSRVERSSRRSSDTKEKGDAKEKKDRKEKKEDPQPAVLYAEERSQLESLINYVAFQRPEQQRAFLPYPGRAASSEKGKTVDGFDRKAGDSISGAAAGIANDEAQMVLRGSMKLKRSDVAKTLYDQLVQSQVELSRGTFELLIEACVNAKDLPGASDFMMKMEQQGLTPATDLMDKVMDLYTERKKQEEFEDAPLIEMPHEHQVVADASEEVLESLTLVPPLEVPLPPPEAPMNYIMQEPLSMPMFNWDAIEDSDDDDDNVDGSHPPSKLSADAPVFVPSFTSIEKEAWETSTLSAAAAPFEPQSNSM